MMTLSSGMAYWLGRILAVTANLDASFPVARASVWHQ
jgi:hypothetical protein